MAAKWKVAIGLAAAGAVGVATARYVARKRRHMDLYDSVVLVTGGSRGLGLLLAREYANRGARVAVCARESAELEAARDDLRRRGASLMTIACDVTNRDQVSAMIKQVVGELGPIDVLVNSAGVVQVGPMEAMTVEDYDRAMRTHFYAPLYATLEVVPGMQSRRRGRIVNVSSIGGTVTVPHLLPYSASKFALVGLSEGLRAELEKDNVYVTTVIPAVIRNARARSTHYKGRDEEEYAWRALAESLPGATMDASYAAWRIVEATTYGDAEMVLSLPAKLASIARALFPEPVADTLALVSQALPLPQNSGDTEAGGSSG